MAFYWLISIPSDKASPFEVVNKIVANQGTVSRFPVPELRVGTLDTLMALSDDLVKYDTYVEGVTKKISGQLLSLVESEKSKKEGLFLINTSVSAETYLKTFKWEDARFSTKSSLREIVDLINQQVSKLDEELKAKSSQYITLANSVAAEERKASGNLLTRDLSDIVKPAHVTETEYLTTIFVAVPKSLEVEWKSTYEKLTEFVLPGSAKQISEDGEYVLVSINLFKKVVEDFKNRARDKKFTVREFKLNTEQIQSGQELKRKLADDKEKAKNKLLLWAKTNFSEAFVAWSHIKAIRIFVESILRYGLPPNFQPLLVLPARRDDKKLRDLLNGQFRYLGSQYAAGNQTEEESLFGNEAYYPYVSLNLNTEFLQG